MPVGVYVFGYDFPHRKTEDLLIGCMVRGLKVDGLLAAPKKDLPSYASWKGYTPLPSLAASPPKDLCVTFGVPYHVVAHEDSATIKQIVEKDAIGIVGGARIIPSAVIDAFNQGIVNYHPGPIPETSGLDSFYWMIEKKARPEITTHFIDDRVDAGRLIERRAIDLDQADTPATVTYKLYLAQLASHRTIVDQLAKGVVPKATELSRPSKNKPMSDKMRRVAVGKFPGWLQAHMTSGRPAR